MPYEEYKYMSTHGLEADKRKLEAYMKYCDVEQIRDQCKSRINAIVNEIDLRSETEIYNQHKSEWKQINLF